MLALWAVSVSAGVIDAVWFATTLALIEAMSVMSTLALLDGMDDLSV